MAGLPDPRKDHHIVMARFARDILVKVQVLLAELEMELGGGTSELGVRIGLHRWVGRNVFHCAIGCLSRNSKFLLLYSTVDL